MDKSFFFRIVRRVFILGLLGMGIAAGVVWLDMQADRTATTRNMQDSGTTGVNAGGMQIGGDFTMVDHTGKTVTQDDFAGQYKLIYFGYSYCPDVCPSELQRMVAALDMAGGAADDVLPVFVSIDPARDTPEQLAEYVPMFHPRMVGLTGSAEQVAAMADAWKIYYARAEAEGSTNYLMDHSSYIYLMGPDDAPLKIFRPQTKPADMAAQIRAVVDSATDG